MSAPANPQRSGPAAQAQRLPSAPQADKNVRAPSGLRGGADIPVRSEGDAALPRQADKNVRAPVPAPAPTPPSKAKTLLQRRVYETVAQKRQWAGPPEPAEAAVAEAIGSKGWNTRGFLPHYDQPGTVQMVTFRLADALPAACRHEWEPLLAIADKREQRTQLEAYADRGLGECVLRQPAVAAVVEEVFLRFDGRRYRMAAWVVMPNHVHLLFELWEMPMGQLLKAWKGASANAVNRLLGRQGTLWQEDYWDRHLRDEEHFRKAKHYIEWNPVKAHLVPQPELWAFSSAHPKWQWSGAERYRGGHLLNPPPSAAVERGHSCPPERIECMNAAASTQRQDSANRADKNVRAPFTPHQPTRNNQP